MAFVGVWEFFGCFITSPLCTPTCLLSSIALVVSASCKTRGLPAANRSVPPENTGTRGRYDRRHVVIVDHATGVHIDIIVGTTTNMVGKTSASSHCLGITSQYQTTENRLMPPKPIEFAQQRQYR